MSCVCYVGWARVRAVSDALRRGFSHRALRGPTAAGAPRSGFRDTGAYVVTRFIDLAEQRRTCVVSCARGRLDARGCRLGASFGGLVLNGRRTSPRSASDVPLDCFEHAESHPWSFSLLRARAQLAALACTASSTRASKGAAGCVLLRRRGCRERYPSSQEKTRRASVLQWR